MNADNGRRRWDWVPLNHAGQVLAVAFSPDGRYPPSTPGCGPPLRVLR